MTQILTDKQSIGRNEPCPCGSGKKYKRCCGVNAAPKLTVSTKPSANMPPMDPSLLEGMNPDILMQFTQALQRLPKGQIQRFQTLMQKAMNGKDVAKEAEEFEKTLPLEFQTMMSAMGAMGMGAAGGAGEASDFSINSSAGSADIGALGDFGISSDNGETLALDAPLSEEEARALVAKAAIEGKISKEQADALLKGDDTDSQGEAEPLLSVENGETNSKFRKFWKNLSKSK